METWSWCLERKLIGGKLGIIEVKWVLYYLKNKNKRGHVSCDHAFETFKRVWIICGLKHAFQICYEEKRRGCSNLTPIYILKCIPFFGIQTSNTHVSLVIVNPRSPSTATLICGHSISHLFFFFFCFLFKIKLTPINSLS